MPSQPMDSEAYMQRRKKSPAELMARIQQRLQNENYFDNYEGEFSSPGGNEDYGYDYSDVSYKSYPGHHEMPRPLLDREPQEQYEHHEHYEHHHEDYEHHYQPDRPSAVYDNHLEEQQQQVTDLST